MCVSPIRPEHLEAHVGWVRRQLTQQFIGNRALAFCETIPVVQRRPNLCGTELVHSLFFVATPPLGDQGRIGLEIIEQECGLQHVSHLQRGILIVTG
ncbi:hypothetical protein D3C85_1315390 [compost metagenome]